MKSPYPEFVGDSPVAAYRQRAVRDALLASETARWKAMRVLRQAYRQARPGSHEAKVWSDLLRRLQDFSPWEA